MVAPWCRPRAKQNKAAKEPVQTIPEASPAPLPASEPQSWSSADKKSVLIDAAKARGLKWKGLTKAQILELLRSK